MFSGGEIGPNSKDLRDRPYLLQGWTVQTLSRSKFTLGRKSSCEKLEKVKTERDTHTHRGREVEMRKEFNQF